MSAARFARTLSVAFLVVTACGKDDAAPGGTTICAAGRSACGLSCFDITSDPVNCGGCGIPCSPAQTCQAGACRCAPGASCQEAWTTPEVTGPTLITSAPEAYWSTGVVTPAPGAKADVTVKDDAPAQVWEGFGGAFNEKGWALLSSLSPTDRDAAIGLLYGADGARFAFGRIPIGASDYALDRYTLDETPYDPGLATFSLERDKLDLIPFVKAALAQQPNLRLWASPWTPPTWMKQGPFSPGVLPSPFDGGSMKDDDATLAALAQYLVRFVTAYAAEGIKIEAVSAQNEPNYTGNYPTCAWTLATYAKFVGQFFGPTLTATAPGTKLVLGTFNGGGDDRGIVSRVMGDASARPYVNVLGYQWGMVDSVGRARPYDLPVWQTEHKCGNYPWLKPFNGDTAPNDHAYAIESWGLIRDWIKAGVTAYSAWNLVLDAQGVGIDTTRVWPQNALLIVDPQAKTVTPTPTYQVFRHVSRFVPPGSHVIATSGGDALAFKTPAGATVAVLFNAGAAKATTVAIAGEKLQFAMPANGWATLVVP